MATTRTRPRSTPAWEAIAARAYEISQGEDAGSPDENWLRAEHELNQTPRRRSTRRTAVPESLETAA